MRSGLQVVSLLLCCVLVANSENCRHAFAGTMLQDGFPIDLFIEQLRANQNELNIDLNPGGGQNLYIIGLSVTVCPNYADVSLKYEIVNGKALLTVKRTPGSHYDVPISVQVESCRRPWTPVSPYNVLKPGPLEFVFEHSMFE